MRETKKAVKDIRRNRRQKRFPVQAGGGAVAISEGAELPIDLADGAQVTGVLDETNGGTGQSTVTQGDLLYGSGANVWAKLAKSASATRYLSNTGASNNPAWAQVDLSNGVTGQLPTANVADDAVTYAKIQNVSAASKLLGRGSAGGAGNTEEITLGTNLSMSGTTLNVSGFISGASWVLLDSWTHSADVSEKIFTGLAGYSEIIVLCRAITKSITGLIALTVSIDNGSTFLTTSGDYIHIDDSGAHTNAALINLHTTNSNSARGSLFTIRQWNLTSPKTYSTLNRVETTGSHGLIPTANDLDALRIFPSGGGNFTAGSIYIYGRG